MPSIHEIILQRQRGIATTPLQHHEELNRLIKLLNEFLQRDIKELEKIFEFRIKSGEILIESRQKLILHIARTIFGNDFLKVERDSQILLRYFQFGGPMQRGMRLFYFKLISHKLKINRNGTTNLEQLVPDLIKLTDYTYVQNRAAFDSELSDWTEYERLRALIFFVLIILISNIAIQVITSNFAKQHNEQFKLITQIFYGNSLSAEQFMFLKKYKLDGGIVFRGLHFKNVAGLCAILASKNTGTSWSYDRRVAMAFTEMRAVKDKCEQNYIHSLAEFKEKFSANEHEFYATIDDPEVALAVAKELSAPNYNRYSVFGGIIFSYPLISEPNFYVAKEFSWIAEKEILLNPKFFKVSKFSADVYIKITVQT